MVAYFVHGLGAGWIAPAVEWLQSNETSIVTSVDEISWIASISSIGSLISTVLTTVTVAKIGTKYLFVFQAILLVITWWCLVTAKRAVTIIVSMLVSGLSYGVAGMLQCIYFGEIPSSDNRGLFTAFAVLTEQVGDKLELISSEFVSFEVFTLVPFIASVVAFVTCFFMKESPHQLLLRNKKEQACRNFAWLSGKTEEENRPEMDELVRYIEEERQSDGFLTFIREPANYNSCAMAVVTFVLAHIHCGMVIRIYGILILKPFAYIMTGKMFLFVYGLLHVGLWFANPIIMKACSPRKLLLVGFLLTSSVQFVCAGLFYTIDVIESKWTYLPYGIFVAFYLFEIVHVVTIYPAAYILQTELFPQQIKAGGMCVTRMLRSAANFVFVKTFVIVWYSVGLYWNFIIFASVHVVGLVYVYVVVPETKGKTLMEIRHDIKTKYENYAPV